MKLYTATIETHRSKPGTLLVEGSVAEIIAFINSLGSTYGVYHFTPGDLEENGGNWGFPPEDWTTEAPYYYQHGDKTQGGFESLQEALIAYVDDDEGVLLARNSLRMTGYLFPQNAEGDSQSPGQ